MYVTKLILRVLLCSLALLLAAAGHERNIEPVVITEEIGTEIDLSERNKYGLFLFVKNFESAVLQQSQEGNYIFIVKYFDQQTQAAATREIEITAAELQQIRSKIENFNAKKEEDAADAVIATDRRPQTELIIGMAYLITNDYDNDVASQELFFSLDRYHTVLGVGINLLTTYYSPIISANICAAYPRNFLLTPYLSGGFCLSSPLLLNYSVGLKLALLGRLGIMLEYRTRYKFEYKEIFEKFYTAGLNISF
jgi:hypothetical protein